MQASTTKLSNHPAFIGNIETRGAHASTSKLAKCLNTLGFSFLALASLCPVPCPTPGLAPHTAGTVAGQFSTQLVKLAI